MAKRQVPLLPPPRFLQDKLRISGHSLDPDTASCVTSDKVSRFSEQTFLHLESRVSEFEGSEGLLWGEAWKMI